VVLKKQAGGFWKIHLDAGNSAAPMPAPAAKKKRAATVKGRVSRPKSGR
jgi:tagatose-1,6-bisphosphate aldolase non-catalytic subunit AgaZ/GatZ